MPAGPPKALEALAGFIIPSACREEVLGDLRERYRNPGQYLADLMTAAPWIVFSRIRRTTNLQFLVLDASLIYGCFLASAWYRNSAVEQAGLLRLVIPAGITLLWLLLSDVFVSPSGKWGERFAANAVLMFLLVFAVMPRVDIYGFFAGMALHFTLRWAFSPEHQKLQSAFGPSIWMRTRLQALEGSRSGKLFLDAVITLLCLVAVVIFLWVGHRLRGR
jgi:hypothetical protein